MTDRVPGAPGQYQALITAGALAKMQSGEAFPIILTRDDQPIVPGTPYSKAAVLPDALAQKLCPGNPDPTPADALAALLPATHADDKNNPHGVTPAQIGAAPAGAVLNDNEQVRNHYIADVLNVDLTSPASDANKSGYFDTSSVNLPRADVAFGVRDVYFENAGFVIVEARCFMTDSSSATFKNTFNQNAGGWLGWDLVYDSRHKPSAGDVGALPITGGIINGTLDVGGKVGFRTDGEGGNIDILPPDGSDVSMWEVDAHDGNLRFIAFKTDGTIHGLKIWKDGSVSCDNPTQTRVNLGAMPIGYSGVIYADANGGTTSFNLPDVTETRNYLGIIRGLNANYTAVYAFCGYQNSYYVAIPIVTHANIGVSAQNGNTVTVTNNTGHNALYVRMIDMSIL